MENKEDIGKRARPNPNDLKPRSSFRVKLKSVVSPNVNIVNRPRKQKQNKTLIQNSEKYKKMRKQSNDRNKRYLERMTPEQLEDKKRKDRERYHKKKEMNLIVSINEKSDREKRQQRRIWRKHSKNYRQKKKSLEAVTLTPTISPLTNVVPLEREESLQKKRGRKLVKKSQAKVYRDNAKKTEEIRILKKKLERYKKRMYRERKKMVSLGSPSPNKNIRDLLKGKQVSKPVRRQLLFGFALKKQLENQVRRINPRTKEQQIVCKAIGSNILRKYKVQNMLKKVVPYKLNQKLKSKVMTYNRKKRIHVVTPEVKKVINDFFEDDRTSKMLPGKKDFVVRNKVKKQRRILLDTLLRLHIKFKKMTNIDLSYRTFCKEKPFWVQQPRAHDRETCACISHANIDFLVAKLSQLNVISIKSLSDLLKEVACSTKDKNCMLGQCTTCIDCSFPYSINDDKLVSYFKWKTVDEEKVIKGTVKKIKRTVKATEVAKISAVVQNFQSEIKAFKKHVFYQRHQANALVEMKRSLDNDEILFHIDFSENYVGKLAEEVQSMHFGASKRQMALHTGVCYMKKDSAVISTSFGTISNNLDHQSHAIWAHLEPVLEKFAYENDGIKKVHFWSDGPTSQYRNRYNLKFAEEVVPLYFENVTSITWNFTEAGHGKGAMDGVGGTIKRTADDLVRKGRDIISGSDLVQLQDYFENIFVTQVDEEDILKFKARINKETKPIKGIMQVHQVMFNIKESIRDKRHLSCLQCPSVCSHWSLNQMKNKTKPSKPQDCDNVTIHCKDTKMEDGAVFLPSPPIPDRVDPDDIKAGIFVLVALEKKFRYVAVCSSELEDNGEVEVMYLKNVGEGKSSFKTVDNDISYVHYSDILSVLSPPNLVVKGDRIYYKFDDAVDICENR